MILTCSSYSPRVDNQLAVLSDHLYPSLFKIVLESLWTQIVKDVTEMISPPNQGSNNNNNNNNEELFMSKKQATHLVHHFEVITESNHSNI